MKKKFKYFGVDKQALAGLGIEEDVYQLRFANSWPVQRVLDLKHKYGYKYDIRTRRFSPKPSNGFIVKRRCAVHQLFYSTMTCPSCMVENANQL